MTIRVLLVDDHTILRQSLHAALQRERDIEVVGETGNGAEAPGLARDLRTDVVVMDIGMPSVDGIAATRQIVAAVPGVKVLGLSAHTERCFILEMLQAGASGYVHKASPMQDILQAIRALSAGRTYLCHEATALVVDSVRCKEAGKEGGGTILRRREQQVLALVVEGLSSREIADKLHIAKGTVDVHRHNIMRKLGIDSIAQLVKYAIRRGMAAS